MPLNEITKTSLFRSVVEGNLEYKNLSMTTSGELLGFPGIPKEFVEEFLKNINPEAFWNYVKTKAGIKAFEDLCQNPTVPFSLLEKYLFVGSGVGIILLENILKSKKSLSPRLINKILESRNLEQKNSLIENTKIPDNILIKYIRSVKTTDIERQAVAKSEYTTKEPLFLLWNGDWEDFTVEKKFQKDFKEQKEFYIAKLRGVIAARGDFFQHFSDDEINGFLKDFALKAKTNKDWISDFFQKEFLTGLARNPSLPLNFRNYLLKIPDVDVRKELFAHNNFSKQELDALVRKSTIAEKGGLLLNPNLGQKALYDLLLDKRLWKSLPDNFSKTTRTVLPVEINYYISSTLPYWIFQNWSSLFPLNWNTLPVNHSLVGDISGWYSIETKDSFHLLNKEAASFENTIKVIKKGKFSSPAKYFYFNMPSTWVGWRAANETNWKVLSQILKLGNKTDPILLLFNLPENVNGWIMAKQQRKDKKLLLQGALPSPDGKPHFWWCGNLTPNASPDLKDLPSIKVSYDSAKLLTPRGSLVDLVGTAILDGALFALWKKEAVVVGWTLEKSANSIPQTKTLAPSDLAPSYLLTSRIKAFDVLIRKWSAKAISL